MTKEGMNLFLFLGFLVSALFSIKDLTLVTTIGFALLFVKNWSEGQHL